MQRKRSLKPKSRKKLFYLIVFLVIVLVIWGILSIFRKNQWEKIYRFTTVINSNPLYVVSIEPNYHKIAILKVPADVYLAVPYGYGNYPATSVFALGLLDQKRGGGKLLAKSIENTFGIITEGYLALGKEKPDLKLDDKNDTQKIKGKFFSFVGLLTSIPEFASYLSKFETNLSPVDKFNLWNAIRSTRLVDITTLDFSNTSVFSEQKLPDGTVVKVIDSELFDAFIADKFQDQLIRSEKVSLEIINATDQDGIAALFARILRNLGANVVAKSTAEKSEDFNCLIRLSEKKTEESHIVRRLKRLYQCKVDTVLPEKNIADVQVILGNEFLK